MKHQKILNLLNEANVSKFEKVLKFNICDYNDVYVSIRDNKTIIKHHVIQVAFKNCAPVSKCILKILLY